MSALGPWGSFAMVMLLGCFAASEAYPWGDTGHEIICEITFQELTPAARNQIRQLLQPDPDFQVLSKACTWPDHPCKRAGEHFVNLPRSATGLGDDPCPVSSPCLVTAIDADLTVFTQADAPVQTRLDALKSLGHWVGDVHQPLHVSFKDERGGNEIVERGPCRDDLHAVWNSCILERKLGKDIRHIASDLRSVVTDAERAAWTSRGPKDWANESFAITTSAVVRYCVKTEAGCWYEEEAHV